ncbi:MAG: hypothetical protein JWP75_2237 [Frondihabitans sp.]|nr:hypothetical protein [Frondihabitans sp.]
MMTRCGVIVAATTAATELSSPSPGMKIPRLMNQAIEACRRLTAQALADLSGQQSGEQRDRHALQGFNDLTLSHPGYSALIVATVTNLTMIGEQADIRPAGSDIYAMFGISLTDPDNV